MEMGALDQKWSLDLKASARSGDISSVLIDVLNKLRQTATAALRHAFVLDVTAKVSVLLCDQSLQLNQAVLDNSCEIISQCCQVTDSFRDETQMYSFLCSLFHAIKVFLQKSMIKEVLELRVHIIRLTTKDTKSSEKIALIIRKISTLYITEILNPLRETYVRKCDDESYFSLINVLDDIVDLLMCGGIHNLLTAINQSVNSSILKSKHTTEKCNARRIDVLMKIVNLADLFQNRSCKLVQNGPELCRDYLLVVHFVAHHEKGNFKSYKEALSKLDQVSTFFESDQNLCNCIKFYKHFSEAFTDLLEEGEPSEIEEKLELGFDALSTITQQSDIDEVTFKVLLKTCDSTSRFISTTYSKLREKSCEWWNQRMSIGLLSSINKVILEMDNVLDGKGHSDCVAADLTACPLQSSSKYDVILMSIVSKLILVSLKHKLKDVHLMVPQAVIVQKTSLKHVESLKELGCVQWQMQWMTVARASYNLGYFCSKSDLKNHQNAAFSDLLDSFLHLEDLSCPVLTCFSVWECITELFQSYMSMRKLRCALVLLVTALAAVPDKKKEIFQLWLTVKNNKLAGKLKDVSLWKIYSKEKSQLQSKYCLDYEKNVVEDEIAVLELEAVSCTSVTGCLGDEVRVLEKSTLDPKLRARTVVALLKRSRTVDDAPSEAVLTLAKSGLEHIPTVFVDDNRDFGFILVELAFWTFLCQLKADRNKMKAEMDRGKEQRIPTQMEDLQRGTDDVVPAYCNLDVSNEMRLLDLLGTTVTIASGLVDSCKPEDFKVSDGRWDSLRNKVEVSARIFEAFGYDHRALGSWALLSKLATLLEDQPTLLLALGHLLAELDHDPARSLLQKGDLLAESLSTNTKKEVQEIVISYFLNKAVGCLKNERYLEGKLALKKAFSLLATCTKETVLHAQSRLLRSKFQLLSPGLVDVEDLGEMTPHISMLQALVTIKELAKIRVIHDDESRIVSARHPHSLGHSGQIMKVFCGVTLWYAQLCVRQGFAREFTQSTPSLLVTLQRQALALRSAQLMSVLTYMDLVCESPNSQVKINAMENITLLGKSVSWLQLARKTQKTVAKTPTRLELARSAAYGRRSQQLTPIFKPVPFTAPEFMSHADACHCVHCISPEIQTVALDIISLQAWCHSLQGNSNQAVEFFKGATCVHKSLFKKQTIVFDELAKTLQNNLNETSRLLIRNGSWKGTLFRIKFQIDLSFVDFHVRHDLVKKALEMNCALRAALKKFPSVDGILYPEVLHQRICCESRLKIQRAVATGTVCSPRLVKVGRTSIGQAVAETPLGRAMILGPKNAPRPFNVFIDRYPSVVPKVIDLNTPSPSTRPARKPAMSSAAILQQVLKDCGKLDSDDFVDPSPEVIPSSRRKAWTGSRLTKPDSRSTVRAKSDLEFTSPVMPEPKKKLLFNIKEESTKSSSLKQYDKNTKQARELDAPEKPQKPVKIATSRAKLRLDEIKATSDATSKKEGLLLERRMKKQAEKQAGDVEISKAAKSRRAQVPVKVRKPSTSTDDALIGEDDETHAANLLNKMKIEPDDRMQEPTKSREKNRECTLPDALLKPRKEKTDDKKVVDVKTMQVTHKVQRARTARNKEVDPGDGSKKQSTVASERSESVTQVTAMVEGIKLEQNDGNKKTLARQLRAAKPTLAKPKIKVSGSSTSSSESSKVNTFRSPLKAGLENKVDPSSPVITRRGRRALL